MEYRDIKQRLTTDGGVAESTAKIEPICLRLTRKYSYPREGCLALNTAYFQYSEWFASASPAYVGFDSLRSVR